MKSIAIFLLILISDLSAQDRTVGVLLNHPDASNGYTLFAPLRSTSTWLIDMEGRIVNEWQSGYRPGNMAYLLENGSLLRAGALGGDPGEFGTAGGAGGIIQEFDWEGNLLWEYRYANDSLRQHHDAIGLPSGNVLLVAWELVPADRAIALGRDPGTVPEGGLWVDHLVEVLPILPDSGRIVWEWHALDHLVQEHDAGQPGYGTIADQPERIDFNHATGRTPREDWLHINAVAYNPELDQVVVSVPMFNEIMVIDHSTTTEEAATGSGGAYGRGGDILYRWGNPAAYGAGGSDDQQLYFQHNAHWIPEGYPGGGNILIFNNGQGRPDGEYSSVVELVPPVQPNGTYAHTPGLPFGPTGPVWTYTAPEPTDLYSATISGAERMPNGNTLICAGETGRFFEVTSEGRIVWEYICPVTNAGTLAQGDTVAPRSNLVFRALRYAPDYAAFTGRDLTPGEFVERYPSSVMEMRDVPEVLDIE